MSTARDSGANAPGVADASTECPHCCGAGAIDLGTEVIGLVVPAECPRCEGSGVQERLPERTVTSPWPVYEGEIPKVDREVVDALGKRFVEIMRGLRRE